MKKMALILVSALSTFSFGETLYQDRCSRGPNDLTISSRRLANDLFDVYINGMYRGGADVSQISRAVAKGDSVVAGFSGKYWKYCSVRTDALSLSCDIKENVTLFGLIDFDSRYENLAELSRVKYSFTREAATKRTVYNLELTEASSGRTQKIEYIYNCK